MQRKICLTHFLKVLRTQHYKTLQYIYWITGVLYKKDANASPLNFELHFPKWNQGDYIMDSNLEKSQWCFQELMWSLLRRNIRHQPECDKFALGRRPILPYRHTVNLKRLLICKIGACNRDSFRKQMLWQAQMWVVATSTLEIIS